MRIGPRKKKEKSNALYDWVDETGNGVAAWYEWGAPSACIDFVIEQLKAFNMQYDPIIDTIIEHAVNKVLYYTDVIDPYCLLIDLSDLTLTPEWESHTFELLGNPTEIAKPDKLETYMFVPGQAEYVFNYIMSRPSLKDIPRDVGERLQEEIQELVECADEFYSDWEDIQEFCGNPRRYEEIVEVSAWASFAWLAGPLGRSFRTEHSLLHEVAFVHGEAILYETEIISPKRYRKIARPANCCKQCGLDSYCNELVELGGMHQFLCEHCLNQGLVLYKGATCGSRVCKFVECMHHPYHSKDRNGGLYQTMRQSGLMLGKKSDRLLIA